MALSASLVEVVVLLWSRSRILLPSALVHFSSRSLVPLSLIERARLTLALLLSFQRPHLVLIFHILLLEVRDVAHLLFVSVDQLLSLSLGVFDDLLVLGEILGRIFLHQMVKDLCLLGSIKLVKDLLHDLDGRLICRKLGDGFSQDLLWLSVL